MSLTLTELWQVAPLSRTLAPELQSKIDQKTKPAGSLGKLEGLALQLGLIQNTLSPTLQKPTMMVFAGDHGIAHAGVSAFPQAVTAQMVLNFLHGGAAINVFARTHGLDLFVVNAGVAVAPQFFDEAVGQRADFINTPVAQGTANFAEQAAMSTAQVEQALLTGAALVAQRATAGSNVLACGEMGIANTSAAACLISRLAGLPLADCVGRGTGLDDTGLHHKQAVLQQALERHADAQSPLAALAAFGGFEIAMMTGAYLEAARRRMVIVVDGFITTAALLVAAKIAPAVLECCVFSHRSHEAGHRGVLAHLQADPLLQLDLRLGEGTGAALAYPLIVSAAAFLNDMASFASAGVSGKNE